MIKLMTNHTTKWEFFLLLAKFWNSFINPLKHINNGTIHLKQEGITLAHIQKLSKVNDRIWNYSRSYVTIWPKLWGQGWNCLIGAREKSHYKFQNCLLSVITPLKKLVKEDTRLARMCENVNIALEENLRLQKTRSRNITPWHNTPLFFIPPPPPMTIIWRGCLI
jgi:hypothetical protein